MADDEMVMVVVLGTDNMTEAVIIKSLLEEAGIKVLERQSGGPWLTNVWVEVMHPAVQLLVLQQDAQQAVELIESFRKQVEAGELELPEEES